MQHDHWVVVNDEQQYSLWPANRPVPPGWSTVGDLASRAACLERIEELWVDMRPRSLREAMRRGGDAS